MAKARIIHRYPDGSSDECTFEVDASYPDACAEAVARVADLFRTACQDGEEADE